MVERLNDIAGLSCLVPEGAFYAFPDCSGLFGRVTPDGTVIKDDRQFCSWLLDTANVAVVPGSAFGLPGYFRISYATAAETLDLAMTRIAEAVAQLRMSCSAVGPVWFLDSRVSCGGRA